MTHISIVPNDLYHTLGIAQSCDPSSSPAALDTTFMRLPHPRTGVPTLFLPSNAGTTGSDCILELQAISPHANRSWFIEGNQIVSDGKLLLMTPVDPIFLLIPILQAVHPEDGTTGTFRPPYDIFEGAAINLSNSLKSSSIDSKDILRLATLHCVQESMKRVCDYKEITEDLVVYRPSRAKILQSISAKVVQLSLSSNFDKFPSLQRQLARDGLSEEGKEDLRQAGRIRIACDLVSQYLSPDLTNELIAQQDFVALDAYLQALAEEATALAPARPSKTTKEGENDKKRKATTQVSKGVSKLMKVNTTGMNKISSFFKKPKK